MIRLSDECIFTIVHLFRVKKTEGFLTTPNNSRKIEFRLYSGKKTWLRNQSYLICIITSRIFRRRLSISATQENLDHAATINNKDQEIQRLHSLIQKEQQNNHALMIEQEKLRNQSQQLHFENQQRKNRVADVLEQNSQLKKQMDSLSEEMRKLNLALDKTKENNGVLESTNQFFENQLADSQKMIASLMGKLEKQDEKMELLNQKNFDLHESNSQLKAQITLLKSESVP